ncbi:hypothetical protein HJG60_008118 [Phyllostomus discolor]|uniref:Uncharacterized protein n=1 Tax=Phyllostomus discolor TaxID=89673 RepID=A0A833Z8X8_9CHIR|nr:hypothetical protein HJG60_008118 [Phyllostomus discolor]
MLNSCGHALSQGNGSNFPPKCNWGAGPLSYSACEGAQRRLAPGHGATPAQTHDGSPVKLEGYEFWHVKPSVGGVGNGAAEEDLARGFKRRCGGHWGEPCSCGSAGRTAATEEREPCGCGSAGRTAATEEREPCAFSRVGTPAAVQTPSGMQPPAAPLPPGSKPQPALQPRPQEGATISDSRAPGHCPAAAATAATARPLHAAPALSGPANLAATCSGQDTVSSALALSVLLLRSLRKGDHQPQPPRPPPQP